MERGEPEVPQPQPEGKIVGLISAVRGLTVSNVMIIGLLIIVLGPTYIIYRALNDEQLLDRILSTYRVVPSATNCLMREIGERAMANSWVIAAGFAYQGADRWQVAVILNHRPTAEEEASYCETLKLLIDHMHNPDEPFPPEGYGGPR